MGLAEGLTAIREIIHCRSRTNILVAWVIQLPLLVFLFLLSPIIIVGFVFYATLSDLLLPHAFLACATHVPTFYAPFDLKSHYIKWPLLLFPTIFGILHCIGWGFDFPTDYERNLWRVASLADFIIPIVAVPIGFIFARIVCVIARFTKLSSALYEDDLRQMSIILIFTVVYTTARLVLLAQVLSLLGQPGQSPTIFLAVDWTRFAPHLL